MITTVTYCQSLDGFIGLPGRQVILSCLQSLVMTHSIRNSRDAIMVGIGTVLVDKPSLTTRYVENPHNPQVVVIDSFLDTPLDSSFIDRRPILLALAGHCMDKRKMLEEKGAFIQVVDSTDDTKRIDLVKAMQILEHQYGIRSIMIEGGGRIIHECLMNREFRVDELVVTIAPVLLGHGIRGVSMLSQDKITLENVKWEVSGTDMVMRCAVVKH